MSVWGTGAVCPRDEAFLDGRDHRIHPTGASRHASPTMPPGFAWGAGSNAWPWKTTSTAGRLSASLLRSPTPHPPDHPRHTRNPKEPHAALQDGPQRHGPCGHTPVREYQPVHPFDYACRPRLRTRLTRGRRALPRNPWSSSGRDSHPSFATHVCILTPPASTTGFRRRFAPRGTLSYPARNVLPRLRWCA